MNALLLYPEYPETFWGFKHALKFISRKAAQPPLGLLTVGALLPAAWHRKLIDLNVTGLKDKDLAWADIVFIGAMSIQKASALALIERVRKHGLPVVAGGPLFTTDHESFPDVDHLVLDEAEITLPRFLEDFANGAAERIYRSSEFADISATPVPAWELIKPQKYAVMNIQFSRGCPFDCEFCDITVLYGRKVRIKSRHQILDELDIIYSRGWRGSVFFVDDNFIGNRRALKREILPAIIEWMDNHKHPFEFETEASIDLADDGALMHLMVRAGFCSVFVGIETTNADSLIECGKRQNSNRDLMASVNAIHKAGLQVKAGFILGFDSDPPTIFEKLSAFIQNSGIVSPMVGLLNAPRHTRLYKRLSEEGRLLDDGNGDNMDFSLNFVPRMDHDTLLSGYRSVIKKVYSPRPHYERVKTFLKEYRIFQRRKSRPGFRDVRAFLKTIMVLGVIGRERLQYWKLLIWAAFRRPSLFRLAVTFAVYGFQFRKFFEKYL